ncbi:MAG: GNAT family N-acetyltransferase [Dermatophilus congolensis]|nr:GNAT family N-acetyltransferase [Dermatophilus congolensis]
MAGNPDLVVADNPSESRFEAHIGDALAGIAEYELADGVIRFTHTRVFDDFAGQGVAGALARVALDSVRDEGTRKVEPECSFIDGWIEKHPDYQSLVAEDYVRPDDSDGQDD